MKNILFFLFMLVSFNCASQNFSFLEINAKWNSKNNLSSKEILGIKVKLAWLENQPESIKNSVKAVPTLILMRDGRPVHQWQAGINLKLEVTEEEVKKVLDRIK
jgi:hypothetical protein